MPRNRKHNRGPTCRLWSVEVEIGMTVTMPIWARSGADARRIAAEAAPRHFGDDLIRTRPAKAINSEDDYPTDWGDEASSKDFRAWLDDYLQNSGVEVCGREGIAHDAPRVRDVVGMRACPECDGYGILWFEAIAPSLESVYPNCNPDTSPEVDCVSCNGSGLIPADDQRIYRIARRRSLTRRRFEDMALAKIRARPARVVHDDPQKQQ